MNVSLAVGQQILDMEIYFRVAANVCLIQGNTWNFMEYREHERAGIENPGD